MVLTQTFLAKTGTAGLAPDVNFLSMLVTNAGLVLLTGTGNEHVIHTMSVQICVPDDHSTGWTMDISGAQNRAQASSTKRVATIQDKRLSIRGIKTMITHLAF